MACSSEYTEPSPLPAASCSKTRSPSFLRSGRAPGRERSCSRGRSSPFLEANETRGRSLSREPTFERPHKQWGPDLSQARPPVSPAGSALLECFTPEPSSQQDDAMTVFLPEEMMPPGSPLSAVFHPALESSTCTGSDREASSDPAPEEEEGLTVCIPDGDSYCSECPNLEEVMEAADAHKAPGLQPPPAQQDEQAGKRQQLQQMQQDSYVQQLLGSLCPAPQPKNLLQDYMQEVFEMAFRGEVLEFFSSPTAGAETEKASPATSATAPAALPSAGSLQACTRPSFRKRVRPRELPPSEEELFMDCLSSSHVCASAPSSTSLSYWANRMQEAADEEVKEGTVDDDAFMAGLHKERSAMGAVVPPPSEAPPEDLMDSDDEDELWTCEPPEESPLRWLKPVRDLGEPIAAPPEKDVTLQSRPPACVAPPEVSFDVDEDEDLWSCTPQQSPVTTNADEPLLAPGEQIADALRSVTPVPPLHRPDSRSASRPKPPHKASLDQPAAAFAPTPGTASTPRVHSVITPRGKSPRHSLTPRCDGSSSAGGAWLDTSYPPASLVSPAPPSGPAPGGRAPSYRRPRQPATSAATPAPEEKITLNTLKKVGAYASLSPRPSSEAPLSARSAMAMDLGLEANDPGSARSTKTHQAYPPDALKHSVTKASNGLPQIWRPTWGGMDVGKAWDLP